MEIDSLTVMEAGKVKSGVSRTTLPAGVLEENQFLASFSFWRLPAFLGVVWLVAASLHPLPIFTLPSSGVANVPWPFSRTLLIVFRTHPDHSG